MTRTSRIIARLLLTILTLLSSGSAFAHAASTSYLELKIDQATISGEWDVALRDLEEAVGLDADGDGSLTWGEVRKSAPQIEAYALSNLRIEGGSRTCALKVTQLRITRHLDIGYAAMTLSGECMTPPETLHIHYGLLFDIDRLHRGLLKLDFGGHVSTDVFAPDHPDLSFQSGGDSVWRVFRIYLHEGFWHVWTGWDHLLFLAALFLPAATRRTRGGWQTCESMRQPLAESARIVTAFTIAHAATLSIAALGWVHFPTRWVESGVAATVVFAALNNLVPLVTRGLPWIAMFFGLIHGSSVAGALLELGLPATGRVWALLAFNLGVEIAQLTLVFGLVPMGYLLRHRRFYRYGVLLPGSALVMAIGMLWLVERVFDWRPPFAIF